MASFVTTMFVTFLIVMLLVAADSAEINSLIIKQCGPGETAGNGSANQCVYKADPSDFDTLKLDCQFFGQSPTISLTWLDARGPILIDTVFVTQDGGNGTVYSTATMERKMGDVNNGTTFSCLASGDILDEEQWQNITILLIQGEQEEGALTRWMIIVIGAGSAVVAILLIVCGICLCKRKGGCCSCMFGSGYNKATNEELQELRNNLDQMRGKIKNYKPEYVGTIDLRTERLTLGFFGPSGAGKTALIDSLRFALEGKYKATKKPRKDDEHPPIREEQPLTEHIFIIEDHGIVTRERENEIVTFDDDVEEAALTGEKIHCPVLVLDLRERIPGGEARLVSQFTKNANDSYGQNYKVVVTRTAVMDKATKLSLSTGVALDDIQLVENYTTWHHAEDAERSLEMLRFLWKCIEAGERNLATEIKAKTRGRLTEIVATMPGAMR